MADLREAIVSRTAADGTVAGIVAARIRPWQPGQADVYPALTYGITTNLRGHDLRAAHGVAEARVQFDCWSYDQGETVALKTALENLWDGFAGTVSGVTILRSAQIDEQDLSEPPASGTDRHLYRIAVDYRVKYRFAIPTFS